MKTYTRPTAAATATAMTYFSALIITFHQSISRTQKGREFFNGNFQMPIFFSSPHRSAPFLHVRSVLKFIFQLRRSLNDFSQFLSCQRSYWRWSWGEIHLSASTASFSLCATILIYRSSPRPTKSPGTKEEDINAYWDNAPSSQLSLQFPGFDRH